MKERLVPPVVPPEFLEEVLVGSNGVGKSHRHLVSRYVHGCYRQSCTNNIPQQVQQGAYIVRDTVIGNLSLTL
jgi:hypothetical protein